MPRKPVTVDPTSEPVKSEVTPVIVNDLPSEPKSVDKLGTMKRVNF